jgi:hypothetical protein
MPIKLELSLDQINGILRALGTLPYAEVSGLVDQIRAQVIPQLQAEPSTDENS